eukprot:scaffold381_cov168-Ochromonas_danica.AAC.34
MEGFVEGAAEGDSNELLRFYRVSFHCFKEFEIAALILASAQRDASSQKVKGIEIIIIIINTSRPCADKYLA